MSKDNLIQTPEISPDEFYQFISAISNDLTSFLHEKNKKYKGASFQNGLMALVGNMFRQEDKLLRYKHLVFDWLSRGTDQMEFDEPFGESIWDTIRDQLGYAYIGLTICALFGIGPYNFEDVIKDQKEQEYSKKDLKDRETTEDFFREENKNTHDMPPQLRSAIESHYLAYRYDPENFSRELWTTVQRVLHDNASKRYFDHVKDTLFLRDTI